VSLRKIIDAPSSTKNEAKARDPEMLACPLKSGPA
jgi:hypothetical protein